MIEKNISVINFFERLKLEVNFDLIKVVDYWDADLCSIGLMKDRKMIYLVTSTYVNSVKPMYDYDLELIDENDFKNVNVVKEGRYISEDKLIDEIKEFFSI